MTAPIAYSMAGAVETTGLSRSTLERAIRTGQLKAKRTSTDDDGKPTGAWVFTAPALQAFIDGLVDA